MKISIITPVYNRADCIMRCMESATRSYIHITTGSEIKLIIEHVIVDDGSSDDTPIIIKEYQKTHPHVHLVEFHKNRGTNAARNAAVKAAQGEWCIILDSDDYFIDEALQIIIETMKTHPGYKHYMFAPDDMQPYYENNLIIKGANEMALLYPDFLNGHIGGDFIHVCNTEILRRYPFDERIRIYEGVFFLQFFREAQKMWFTNKIVTIRERNRQDSVTRDVIRTNRIVAKRTAISQELYLKNFETELEMLGMQRRLHKIRLELFDNYLLLGEYEKTKDLEKKMGLPQSSKERILRFCNAMHLGWLYRILLEGFLFFKYEVLKKELK